MTFKLGTEIVLSSSLALLKTHIKVSFSIYKGVV